MADDRDREWKKLFGAPVRRAAEGACPQAELLSSWAEGSLPLEGVAHLAACPSCREDLVVLRRQQAQKGKTERVSGELRNRLRGLGPRPTRRFLWISAAAAAVAVGVLMFFLRPSPEPMPVVRTTPMSKPAPVLPTAPIKTAPPLPEAPTPAPRPEPPPPAPLPQKAAPPPAPVPAPPVIVTPLPVPEKPAPSIPAPEKPVTEPTRAALKGTMLAIAGSCSLQTEGETATQSLRPGQKREFPGMIRVKADLAAAKVAVGSVTYYLQRSTELSIQLEEGRTRVLLARGEAFFDVTPGSGLFEVECSQGKVTVKGTRFLVASDKAETEVAVQRGTVDFSAAGRLVSLSPGERSTAAAGKAPAPVQKADLARRLAWVRGLEDFLWIEGEQMALQGGMAILADATASGGRAIGVKDPLKPGAEAAAEIRVRHKQAVPYAVWVRLSWPHNVPSALSLSVGDALHWTSKDVVSAQGWQWVRAGTGELPDDPFRLRLTDTNVGLRVDQLLITSDLDFNPETDKR